MSDKNMKPCLVRLEGGKKYAWCSCGKSKTQPFCDGAHKGTNKTPIVFKAQESEDILLCNCKATKSPPFCDGSHNNLDDGYAEATEEEIKKFSNSEFVERDKRTGKSILDGGAYVLTPNDERNMGKENIKFQPLISKKDGANHLSLHRFQISEGVSNDYFQSPFDTVLFTASGKGKIYISGKCFNLSPEVGVYIRPNETFNFVAQKPLTIFVAICPQGNIEMVKEGSGIPFNENYPKRIEAVDHEKATIMADRFFQLLVGNEIGSNEVTQFLGEVPKSRAAMHQHLYEEAIVILSGKGVMWTETKKTDVNVGDVIFLPKRQLHSLECTTNDGLRLMGVFYPSGSPAINY